jgi:hypothetical protein
MPTITISVLDAHGTGGVGTLRVKSITTAVLKAQSIMHKKPEEHLDNTIDIRNGELLIKYNDQSEQIELLDSDLITSLSDFMITVGQAIHDRPENPDWSVLGKYNQTQRDFGQVVDLVNEYRPEFTELGLFKSGLLKQKYLTPIRHVLITNEDVKELLVCISAVCVVDEQPYVDFFRLKDDYSWCAREGTIISVGCHTTVEQAQKLEELRKATTAKSGSLFLRIEVIKNRKRGKDYQLLTYKPVHRIQNLNLDLT